MKKFIILASLGITIFALAPYHTEAVPMAPGQLASINGVTSTEAPPPPSVVLIEQPPASVPETGATWGLLLLGLTGIFAAMLVLGRREKTPGSDF
jgi:hypothetical protein